MEKIVNLIMRPQDLATVVRHAECGGIGKLNSLAQLSVMTRLTEDGDARINDLADRENVRAATMSKMITALEDRGLVKRVRVEADGRGALVVATTTGKRITGQALRIYTQRVRELYAP